jgi:hypothetical protein
LAFRFSFHAIAYTDGRRSIVGAVQIAVDEVPRQRKAAGVAGCPHIAIYVIVEKHKSRPIVSQRRVATYFGALDPADIAYQLLEAYVTVDPAIVHVNEIGTPPL